MNIVGIIPARMASTRFPGKPLAKICGIPMVGHVYMRSRLSRSLNNLYIATCDDEIAHYSVSIGCEPVMTKDTHKTAADRTVEAMLKLEAKTGAMVDVVVMIQGDEPMLYPEMIDEALGPVLKDSSIGVTNLMSIIKSKEEEDDPNAVKVVFNLAGDALYFSREPIPSRKKSAPGGCSMYRQVPIIPFRRDLLIKFSSLPPTPFEIIESVDMMRLVENGYRIRMVRTKSVIYGVDTPQDLEKVEKLMALDPIFLKYRGAVRERT